MRLADIVSFEIEEFNKNKTLMEPISRFDCTN